jgi:pimeloyl-ACP methyl ester carboxylesterase
MKKSLFLLLLLLVPIPVLAGNLLVLVHGYASNAATWEYSGINRLLRANGWQDVASPYAGDNVYYAVGLPPQAPLTYQASILLAQLQALRARHPQKKLTLVGHSAGGVVARLAILNGNPAGVARLVTIASPNLGTPRASQGLDIVKNKPFFCPGPGWRYMKSSLAGDSFEYLEDSQGALYQMLPPGYISLISIINMRPHPDIQYHSVVRQYGDQMVPSYSQDLNNVPALKGKSRLWLSLSSHFLNANDGQILLQILAGH